MKKSISILLLLFYISAFPQKTEEHIQMKPENWEFKKGTVEFISHRSRPSLKILTSSDKAILKDIDFASGTIEYDFEPIDPRFTSFYFRMQDSLENECFYFRTERAGNQGAVDAVQYAPHVDGVNLWDMLFHFQSNANFATEKWNHVKLIVSGKQMKVFVNDMKHAALIVPKLEGNVSEGLLAFDGQVIISNLIIKSDEVEGLSPKAGLDLTDNDARYLRKWRVSEVIVPPTNIDFDYSYFPNKKSKWEEIRAESRGLINLTRKFGASQERRIVWLKTNVSSNKAKKTRLDLGFSDEVWVFMNKQPLYFDKGYYGTPSMKTPDGRLSLENASFDVPLAKGDNELLICVANNFFGWGIVARFEQLEDLKIEN